MRSGGTLVELPDGQSEPKASQSNSTLLIVGSLVVVAILGLGYIFFGRPKLDPAIQKQLAELQVLKVQLEQQKADIEAKAKVEGEKTTQLQKQLGETKSVEEKAKIQKQLDDAKERRLELERQQKAAELKLTEQKQNEQRLADQKKAAETKLVALPPPPAPEIPKPQPMQETAKTAAVPPPTQQAAAQAAAPVLELARILNQATPLFPMRATQMRWETGLDHTVRLKVFVGEQGQALKVSVIEGVAGAYGFDEAAIEAANKSTYSPATRDGKPVRGWTPEIAYKFPKRK
jgi:TonB family protein